MTTTCIATLLAVVAFAVMLAVMLIAVLDKRVQRLLQEDDDEPMEFQTDDFNPRREE